MVAIFRTIVANNFLIKYFFVYIFSLTTAIGGAQVVEDSAGGESANEPNAINYNDPCFVGLRLYPDLRPNFIRLAMEFQPGGRDAPERTKDKVWVSEVFNLDQVTGSGRYNFCLKDFGKRPASTSFVNGIPNEALGPALGVLAGTFGPSVDQTISKGPTLLIGYNSDFDKNPDEILGKVRGGLGGNMASIDYSVKFKIQLELLHALHPIYKKDWGPLMSIQFGDGFKIVKLSFQNLILDYQAEGQYEGKHTDGRTIQVYPMVDCP